MKMKALFTLVFIVTNVCCLAQSKSFVDFSAGLSYAHFSDFATSPLKFEGSPLYLSIGHQNRSVKRESSIHLGFVFGQFTHETGNEFSKSDFNSLTLQYLELYRLNFLSAEDRSIKAGFQFNTTANFRQNDQLFNSSKGVEFISNLMGSVACSFYFNNSSPKAKELYFNFHTGLVNANYRNPFAYVNDSPVLNDESFFEGYNFNMFSGYRFQAGLGLLWHLKTTNALSLSYVWDAYNTGEGQRSFQMAYHILKFTFHFNLKSS
jgi:hypothetical protein